MKYVPPVGGADNDPYTDGNPANGDEGSPVPAAAIEHPMREIEAVIVASGQVPSKSILNQLLLALRLEGVFSTPDAADKSTKAATTAWLYSAMATVMTFFGFTCSLTTNGYIQFPSILGGVIFQWGMMGTSGSGAVTAPLPVTFPTLGFGALVVGTDTISVNIVQGAILNRSQIVASSWTTASTRNSTSVQFYAFGR